MNKEKEITKQREIKRKPDIETESLRIWKPNKAEIKKEEKRDKSEDLIVKIGDMEFGLMGFSVLRGRKDKKIKFVYKVKLEDVGNGEAFLIYHIFEENLTNSEKEKIKTILNQMSKDLPFIKYIISFKEVSEQILMEKHLFNNTKSEKGGC